MNKRTLSGNGASQPSTISRIMMTKHPDRKFHNAQSSPVSRKLCGAVAVILLMVLHFLFLQAFQQVNTTLPAPNPALVNSKLKESFMTGSTNKKVKKTNTTTEITIQKPERIAKKDRAAEENNNIDDPYRNVNSHLTPKATIAYAISVTGCDEDDDGGRLLDGAAVLRHSIHQVSIRNSQINNATSAYDYHIYAFVHPDGAACAPHLERLGYTVQMRETPIDVEEIANQKYKDRLTNPKSGCCGAKEFLKLYSYTLLDYPIVVHLDLDVVLLKPLDELFDIMMLPDNATKTVRHGMWEQTVTHPIHSMFTRDYPMSYPGKKIETVGMQGGFWLVKPDNSVYEEYRQIILRGEFTVGVGWGDREYSVGGFYGAPQVQGIVPYFYLRYRPHTSIELNRCVYNQMVDVPYEKRETKQHRRCMTGEETCEDCREANPNDIYSIHFTLCQKPWLCPSLEAPGPTKKRGQYLQWLIDYWQGKQGELCVRMHHEWHRLRYELETQVWRTIEPWPTAGQGDPMGSLEDYYYGHCVDHKKHTVAYRYVPLQIPGVRMID